MPGTEHATWLRRWTRSKSSHKREIGRLPLVAWLSCSTAIVLGGCGTKSPPTPVSGDYSCFLRPTSFEGPLSIFRTDADRRLFRVADLSRLPGYQERLVGAVREGAAGGGTAVQRGEAAAGMAINFLERLAPALTARVNADVKRTWSSSAVFHDAREEVTFDEVLPVVRDWYMRNRDQIDRRYDYFLVRDALRAGRVEMAVNAQDGANLGGETTIREIARLSPSVTWAGGNSFTLDETYNPPLRVCIKAVRFNEIVPEARPGTGTAQEPRVLALEPVRDLSQFVRNPGAIP